MSAQREAAQALAAMGAKIFALPERSKIPFPGSSGKDDARCDASRWDDGKPYNIGWIPGSIGKIGCDLDKPDHWADAEKYGLLSEPTFSVITDVNRGPDAAARPYKMHLYFDGKLPDSEHDYHLGSILLRANTGYMLYPSSVKPDGFVYRVDDTFGPMTLADTVPLPPAAVAELERRYHGTPSGPSGKLESFQASMAAETVTEGNRHDDLKTYSGFVAKSNQGNYELTLAAVWDRNLARCKPPKGRKEVEDLCRYSCDAERDKLAIPFSTEPANDGTLGELPVIRPMEGDAPKRPTMLVKGWLLDSDVNLHGAEGASFKSSMGVHTGMCVITGRRVANTLEPVRTGPVLFIAPEDGHASIRHTIEAFAEGMQLSAEERAAVARDFYLWNEDVPVSLLSMTGAIGAVATALGAVLVVIDPIIDVLEDQGDNESKVAGPVCGKLRKHVCRKGQNPAVLLLHHIKKPQPQNGAGPRRGDGKRRAKPDMHVFRGSSGWAYGSRLATVFEKDGNTLHTTIVKANRIRGMSHEFSINITADPNDETHWLRAEVTTADAKHVIPWVGSDNTPASEALTPNERQALRTLYEKNIPDFALAWTAWEQRSGVKGSSLLNARNALTEAGLVEQIVTGTKARSGQPQVHYRITEAGRAQIDPTLKLVA